MHKNKQREYSSYLHFEKEGLLTSTQTDIILDARISYTYIKNLFTQPLQTKCKYSSYANTVLDRMSQVIAHITPDMRKAIDDLNIRTIIRKHTLTIVDANNRHVYLFTRGQAGYIKSYYNHTYSEESDVHRIAENKRKLVLTVAKMEILYKHIIRMQHNLKNSC